MNLYIIQCGRSSCHKIGVARCIDRRIINLHTANPHPLRIAITIKTKRAYKFESLLHRKFWKQHIRGEWYRLTKEDMVTLENIFYCSSNAEYWLDKQIAIS